MNDILAVLTQTPEGRAFFSLFPLNDVKVQNYVNSIINAVDGNIEDARIKLALDVDTAQGYIQANIPITIDEIASIQTPYEQIRQIRAMRENIQPSGPLSNQRFFPVPNQSFEDWKASKEVTPQRQQIVQMEQPQHDLPPEPVIAPMQSDNPADVVSPFFRDVPMTQSFNNYNPGMGYYNNRHKGEDFGTMQGEQGRFPIGGEVLESRYDPMYGNTVVIRGQNPQEYRQSAPNRGNRNVQDDYVRLSHLQTLPNVKQGDYVATGSAGIIYGNTGNSTGPHVDIESGIGNPSHFANKRAFTGMYKQVAHLNKYRGSGGTGGGGVPPQKRPKMNLDHINKLYKQKTPKFDINSFRKDISNVYSSYIRPVAKQVEARMMPKLQNVREIKQTTQPFVNIGKNIFNKAVDIGKGIRNYFNWQ